MEDGCIVGRTTTEHPAPGNTVLIWRGDQPADVELRMGFNIRNFNGGVQFRSRDLGNFVVSGYQAEVDQAGTAILDEEKGRGRLADFGSMVTIARDGRRTARPGERSKEDIIAAAKAGQWVDLRVIAEGPKLTGISNGVTSWVVTDEQEGRRAAAGLIALQLHGGPPMELRFRDIRLKRLGAAAKAP